MRVELQPGEISLLASADVRDAEFTRVLQSFVTPGTRSTSSLHGRVAVAARAPHFDIPS